MNKFRSYAELLAERNKLEAQLATQKESIKNDFRELQEEFKPALRVFSFIGKVTKPAHVNPLATAGIALAADTLIANSPIGRGTKLARSIVPFLVKITAGLVLGKGAQLLQKFRASRKKTQVNGRM